MNDPGLNRDGMVVHLCRMARLAAIYNNKPAAQRIWQKDHRPHLGEYPTAWISLNCGFSDVDGLIVGGDWTVDHGWDLDGEISVLTEDGALLTVRGWMSSDVELIEAPCVPGECLR